MKPPIIASLGFKPVTLTLKASPFRAGRRSVQSLVELVGKLALIAREVFLH